MTDAPDLLPCPFCGSTRAWPIPAYRKSEDRLYPIVRCGGCFMDLPGENDDYSLNAKSAVAMWNTRSDLIPAMLAKARAEGREQGLREAAAHVGVRVGRHGTGFTQNCQCGMCNARREDHVFILDLLDTPAPQRSKLGQEG